MLRIFDFTWDASVLPHVQPCSKKLATDVYYSNIPEFVLNDIQMDNLTLARNDIYTLFYGISVGGYKTYELAHATKSIFTSRKLYDLVEHDDFDLNKETLITLCQPKVNEERKTLLDFDKGVEYIKTLPPYEGGLIMFIYALRKAFYTNQYKITSMQMMNGWLMKHGFEAITIPVTKQANFRFAFKILHGKRDATPMLMFLDSCRKGYIEQENVTELLADDAEFILSILTDTAITWEPTCQVSTYVYRNGDLFIRAGESFNGIDVEYHKGETSTMTSIHISNPKWKMAARELRRIYCEVSQGV